MRFFLFAYWHDSRWKRFVGATVKVWDLAHNLSQQGNDVILFLPKYNFKNKNIPFEIVQVPFINYPFLRLVSFNLLLAFMALAVSISRRPKIVYSRRMTSLIPLLLAKIRKAKFFYEINDDPYCSHFNEGLKFIHKIRFIINSIIDELNLKFCDKAFVISRAIKNKILCIDNSIPPIKLKITPSGANTDLFKPHDKHSCCMELKLDPKNHYIGFVGTLLAHQGIDILINSADQILRKYGNCIFLIIGEGPQKAEWQKLVLQNNLSDYFHFVGQIEYEKLPIWIGATDICVAPFRESAGYRSPVKLFDYLSCERPVVASKIEGTTDLFENSGAVELIDPENPDLLAFHLLDLIKDKNRARLMGIIGRELIVSKYDRKLIAQKIYKEAMHFN